MHIIRLVGVLFAMAASCVLSAASAVAECCDWEILSSKHSIRIERLSTEVQTAVLGHGIVVLDGVAAVPLHCIEGYGDLVAVTQLGDVFPLKGSIALDPTIDLALVYVPGLPLEPIKAVATWDDLRTNEEIFVLPSATAGLPVLRGTVMESCRVWLGKLSTVVSVAAAPGHSGRAAFTKDGKFVGLVESGIASATSISPAVLWHSLLEMAQRSLSKPIPPVTPMVHNPAAAYRLWELNNDSTGSSPSGTPSGLQAVFDPAEMKRIVESLKGGHAIPNIASALQRRKSPQATEVLRALAPSASNTSQAQFFIGNAYLSVGDREKALEAFNAVDPGNYKIMAHYALANSEFYDSRFEPRLASSLRSLAATAPDLPATWELCVKAAVRFREPGFGLQACRSLTRLQPSAVEHWFRLGCFALAVNDAVALAMARDRLQQLDPSWANRLKYLEESSVPAKTPPSSPVPPQR